MRISILLPYKENFSPEYPGAVSLFVYETSKISKFKKNITVIGNTNYKKVFNLKYININTKKELFNSQTKNYVNDFDSAAKGNNNIFKDFFHFMLSEGVYLPPSAFESYFLNDALTLNDIDYTVEKFKSFLKKHSQ